MTLLLPWSGYILLQEDLVLKWPKLSTRTDHQKDWDTLPIRRIEIPYQGTWYLTSPFLQENLVLKWPGNMAGVS